MNNNDHSEVCPKCNFDIEKFKEERDYSFSQKYVLDIEASEHKGLLVGLVAGVIVDVIILLVLSTIMSYKEFLGADWTSITGLIVLMLLTPGVLAATCKYIPCEELLRLRHDHNKAYKPIL